MPYEYLIKRHKGSKCFLKLQDHETKNTQPKNVKMTKDCFDNIRFEIWKQIRSDEVHIFLKTSFEFTSKSYSVLGWPWFFILFQILVLLFPCLVVLVANGITDRRMKIIIEFLFKNVYLCGSGLEGLNFLFIWSLKRWLILRGVHSQTGSSNKCLESQSQIKFSFFEKATKIWAIFLMVLTFA
jgi:hypothetical protein